MIVVIFRATVKQLDDEYLQQAGKLRQLALDHYGCLEFTALCEGDKEIALSYWPDEGSVLRWKTLRSTKLLSSKVSATGIRIIKCRWLP